MLALLTQRLVIDFAQIADWKHWIICGCAAVMIVAVIAGIMSLLFYRSDMISAMAVVKRMLRSKR